MGTIKLTVHDHFYRPTNIFVEYFPYRNKLEDRRKSSPV